MLQSMGSQRVGHDLATEQRICKSTDALASVEAVIRNY